MRGQGVEHRGAEQDTDHGEQTGCRRDARNPVERAPHHEPAVTATAERRQPTEQGREHLEPVTAVEPPRSVVGRRQQMHGEIAREVEAQCRQRRVRVSWHELEPDEREQRQRSGPVSEPRRQWRETGCRVGPHQPRKQQLQGADRVDQPPHRSEQQRKQRHSHPQQHVDGGGSGVEGVVLAEQHREQDVRRREQAERPQRATRDRAVERSLNAGRQRPPCADGVESRLTPQHQQREKRDDQRERRRR